MCAHPLRTQRKGRIPPIIKLRGIDVGGRAQCAGSVPVHGFVISLGLS
jgi:hypothetical protein